MTQEKKVTKQVVVTYNNMEDLLKKQSRMTRLITSKLNKDDNDFSIIDRQIVQTQDKFQLKFTLEANI